ncbi:tripartite tricarboxylate transporter substrate binding protein [Roseomonas terrae]|jgi:tripartite-type tricarboxylate transporter receptor subunit TctC|uniref:Tripartite tricarboxylate transporter substrate binding protein n=1 Tax=Neoroseomonas terrae TaxID=424799 RepID=A0ABS5EGG2_9PROT|nr:tripartite tricarboxylate transporter substrate binding protein [Neoroseomonas terrae]MBR0650093.1 tripartite tricarboxylate transporter substrate binding protein [Neoroseomonas terrae]
MRIARRHALTGASAALALPGRASAQAAYPSRPIRVIVPFGPGGGTDILIRILDPYVSRSLGQPLVIENRPGAGSIVGTEAVARSEPDGYTLLAVDSTFCINQGLFPSLPYDAARDFAPVALLANAPIVLLAHPSVPARTLQELIALAKARPGALAYASGGNGAPTHLGGEMFKTAAGVDITHLPYRGTGPAMNDVIAGHVPLAVNGLSASRPHIADGRVRALAVTGDRRASAFPDVPTFAEAGVQGVDMYTHWGVLVRAGTPGAIIQKLATAFDEAVLRPDLRQRLDDLGFVPAGGGPATYGEAIRRDTARFTEVIRAGSIRPD